MMGIGPDEMGREKALRVLGLNECDYERERSRRLSSFGMLSPPDTTRCVLTFSLSHTSTHVCEQWRVKAVFRVSRVGSQTQKRRYLAVPSLLNNSMCLTVVYWSTHLVRCGVY
jgi:hypothetical protein